MFTTPREGLIDSSTARFHGLFWVVRVQVHTTQIKRAPKFTGPSSTAFVKFLGLVNAAALKGNGHDLGAPEVAMLNTLAQSWLAGVPLNVLGAMHANDTCSSTSSHRSHKLLRQKGYITLAVDDLDNRVKAVLPTAMAMQYFDVMGKCMTKAHA